MTRVRLNNDNLPAAPGLNADPDFIDVFVEAWASASNPTAEVVDTAAAELVLGESYGMTLALATGLITVNRPGRYLVGFNFGQVSSASASGVIEFQLQKNSANLSNTCLAKILEPAVAANFVSMAASRVLTLAKGDTLRVVCTGTVGGIITVQRGNIYAMQLSDQSVTHE